MSSGLLDRLISGEMGEFDDVVEDLEGPMVWPNRNLLWDTTIISISALSLISRILFRAFATVLALVLAPILSTLLVSVFWCNGRFRYDGEGDFWRKVRGLMCFRFLGNICFWWKIRGSLFAAMLTCVVVVYPLIICGHCGSVSVPFAKNGDFVLYFG
ncbi:hypothetical protein GBA52_020640 [Prunus armeniaca]|nr:hypothetical protein GBA52_020640 [Prunus armeniaca]